MHGHFIRLTAGDGARREVCSKLITILAKPHDHDVDDRGKDYGDAMRRSVAMTGITDRLLIFFICYSSIASWFKGPERTID
jgi:hypothetical protein